MIDKSILIKFLVFWAIIVLSGCSSYQDRIRTEILPENELYELGIQMFNEGKWVDAIASFDRFERLYTSSQRIQEVRLKAADAQFFRNNEASLILAKSGYETFLSLYPNFDRDDYVWKQIARCSFNQMMPPNRDQSYTLQAIEDLQSFLQRYPDSDYVSEVRQLLQDAYLNLAQYHIIVANHYYGRGIFPSAAQRYKEALNQNVAIEDLENVLFNLTTALARGSDMFGRQYNFYKDTKQQSQKDFTRERHERYLYEAKQYLMEFKDKFPQEMGRITRLQNEINMVTPIEKEETVENR